MQGEIKMSKLMKKNKKSRLEKLAEASEKDPVFDEEKEKKESKESEVEHKEKTPKIEKWVSFDKLDSPVKLLCFQEHYLHYSHLCFVLKNNPNSIQTVTLNEKDGCMTDSSRNFTETEKEIFSLSSFNAGCAAATGDYVKIFYHDDGASIDKRLKEKGLFADDFCVSYASFSNDLRRLVSIRERNFLMADFVKNGVFNWHLSGSIATGDFKTYDPKSYITAASLRNKSNIVDIVYNNRNIITWDLSTELDTAEIATYDSDITDLATHPKDKYLALTTQKGGLRIIDMENKTQNEINHGSKLNCVDFSQNGEYVAVGDENGGMHFYKIG